MWSPNAWISLYPASALPHLNIDNKSLNSHNNEPERTREYVDFKRLRRKASGARRQETGLDQN